MMYNKNLLIRECLIELGFLALAKESVETQNPEVFNGYVRVIQEEAIKLNRSDVIERLQFGGLLYA